VNSVQKGHSYEAIAAAWLAKNGYDILETNYRCRQGEIDLIANDEAYLVFIEVKYRKNMDRQHPLEAVDMKKQWHISRTAAYYLQAKGYAPNQPCRFDVVVILDNKMTLYKDAFPYRSGKGW
jgi:putative endonuclease